MIAEEGHQRGDAGFGCRNPDRRVARIAELLACSQFRDQLAGGAARLGNAATVGPTEVHDEEIGIGIVVRGQAA
jgi:hypothetical protein